MSKVKKILAVVLSMVMVLGMSVTTFAATAPKDTDVATATINNVESSATVTAYQIVDADYNTAGFTGYHVIEGLTIADITAPTTAEIAAIANDTTKLARLVSVKMSAGTADANGFASFTADLPAGEWLVLVSGTVNEVYNPMVVSTYYSVSGSDNTMSTDAVDANAQWTINGTTAYAKSSAPSIDKEIVGGNKDVAIGDTVNYKITTKIPDYSADYSAVIVKIADVLSDGLTLDKTSIVVTDGVTGTLANVSDRGFEYTIDSAYALANGGKKVTVTYSAKVNENAALNFDPNTNTATLTYSNDPSDSSKVKTTDDKTYSYTFAIDAKLNGSSTDEWNKLTQEIIKGEMVKETTESGTTEKFQALGGATFTLTSKTDASKVYTATSVTAAEATTDAPAGSLTFKGLDAGEYTLVETAAPSGYTVNSKEIPVVISAAYNEDGTLKSYSITIDGTATSTYEATYTGTGTTTSISNIVIGEASEATQILNTKISKLPSTGGIGTTIFTIGGVLIMLGAAFLFFRSRKKEA